MAPNTPRTKSRVVAITLGGEVQMSKIYYRMDYETYIMSHNISFTTCH